MALERGDKVEWKGTGLTATVRMVNNDIGRAAIVLPDGETVVVSFGGLRKIAPQS